MKTRELLAKKNEELVVAIADASAKMVKLRFDLVSKKVKNHSEIGSLRRDMARMKTVLRERELIEESKKKEAAK